MTDTRTLEQATISLHVTHPGEASTEVLTITPDGRFVVGGEELSQSAEDRRDFEHCVRWAESNGEHDADAWDKENQS